MSDEVELDLPVQLLPHAVGLPAYAHPGDSGMDLLAAIESPRTLLAGDVALIPTGIAIALPDGFEGQVRSRSGLALKHRLFVLNSPGTLDAGYRGEVGVILMNVGPESFVVQPGQPVAQLVIARVGRARFRPVLTLSETGRGTGGFGSTGMGPRGEKSP